MEFLQNDMGCGRLLPVTLRQELFWQVRCSFWWQAEQSLVVAKRGAVVTHQSTEAFRRISCSGLFALFALWNLCSSTLALYLAVSWCLSVACGVLRCTLCCSHLEILCIISFVFVSGCHFLCLGVACGVQRFGFVEKCAFKETFGQWTRILQNGEVCSVDASVCSFVFAVLALGNLNTTFTKSTSLALWMAFFVVFFEQNFSDSFSELSPHVEDTHIERPRPKQQTTTTTSTTIIQSGEDPF